MEISTTNLDAAFLWENQPDLIVVLSPTPPFIVLNATNAYLKATNTKKENFVGNSIMAPFPENSETNQESGYARVLGLMERCVATKCATTLPIQKYDILNPETGQFEERYWVARTVPMLDPNDPEKIVCLFQKVQDVTNLHRMGELKVSESGCCEVSDRVDLERETDEIRHANEALHAVNNRLQDALKHAEAAVKAKDEFEANMSHELRTPLNAILGFARILEEDEEKCGGKHHEEVSGILSAGEHLLEVINQVLDCAKLESGGLVLQPKSVVLANLLSRCASLVRHLCISKGLELITVFSESCQRRVVLDPLRFRQMILNLLGNAVKFTTEGCVRLEANLSETENQLASLEIAVSDSGPGIPADQIPKLFERFTQVPGRSASIGTGLGLAIVKGIALMMHGNVEVRSQVGVGSTFSVRVLVPFAPQSSSPMPQQKSSIVAPTNKKRVMVVDDNLLNRKVFGMMLDRAGHLPIVVSDGNKAVEEFWAQQEANKPIDCILMDRHMPGIDGIEAASRIRKSGDAGRKVVIYLLTADLIKPSELPDLKQQGIDAVLSKPLTAAELVAALEREREPEAS